MSGIGITMNKQRIWEIRECNCDPFHCYCSEFFKLEQYWWTAWCLIWAVIAHMKAIAVWRDETASDALCLYAFNLWKLER